jgi:DnaK suppressor protein
MVKKYIPTEKEKYMCEKHKIFFNKKLLKWRNEIVESNTKGLYLNDVDREISSADVVDQASSQTEKTVEMRTLNRQIKLLSKIDKAIKRIKDDAYGYCDETGEPIGIKRLIARPIATLSIEAQEKHEKKEKIFADI